MAGVDGANPRELKAFTLTAPGTAELVAMWQAEGGNADELPEDTWVATAMAWWNDGAAQRWTEFLRRMRRDVSARLEAWKVGELQVRGAIHYHGLFRGARFIPMETMRANAVAAGFGWRIGLERVREERGGSRALLGYFTGYLLKAVGEWTRRAYVITMTHGWRVVWRPRRKNPSPLNAWEFVSEREWQGSWPGAMEAARSPSR
jgi:hypothetical protein